MAVSVRMDPLLEKELELAAQAQGITKSQYIIKAVERALGRKNPYELMLALQTEEPKATYAVGELAEQPYETASAKAQLRAKLKARHGDSSAR